MNILGVSAYYHDSAAALLTDGEIIAAAQEERFTRKKHDASFPLNAIRFCLEYASIKPEQLDHIIFYDKPFLKFERLLETYVSFAPRGFISFKMAMPLWIKEKLFQKTLLINELEKIDSDIDWEKIILFSEHHLSHAASTFYTSPYDEAVVLTMDGVGEWSTTSVAIGRENDLKITREIHFPHSLGLLYSAFTYYTGFKVNSGEYKLMGLAPYGKPVYVKKILDNLVDIKPDGSFRLNMKYFNYCTGLTMTNKLFNELFGGPSRTPEEKLTQHHMDIAASIQEVTEIIVMKLARALYDQYKIPNLCLAGGVALNCVANGKLLKEGIFPNIYIQPAAGDAGGAIGAAYIAYHGFCNLPRKNRNRDLMRGSYLGPSFDQADIEKRLNKTGAVYSIVDDKEVINIAAQAIADGQAIGWFQGRMEFGPRALGARSILGDPRSPKMQKELNLKIKFRESFRPFAPSVLREKVSEWFDLDADSPYMLLVADVKKSKQIRNDDDTAQGLDKLNQVRSEIPAVTHVDYSARIQTVTAEYNPRYYELIKRFYEITGCPVLINTSFNVRGEPIVCTPEDAFKCFMGTNLDKLVIGNCVLEKGKQDESLYKDYKHEFELD